jgi:hypothetical protein
MDKESIAWAAGMFEGEGTVHQHRHSVDVSISSTDEDVIKHWGAVVGRGRLYGPYQRKDGHKPIFEWKIGRNEDARAVYELFKPWLGIRRTAQFEKAFEWEPKKPRRGVGAECGYYDRPIACSRGYLLHLSNSEGACSTCRKSHALALKGERKPKFYQQIVAVMRKQHGDAWREQWPDYIPFTVDGEPRKLQRVETPG